MKAIILAALAAGCAVTEPSITPATSTWSQKICTVDDPECGPPGSGWDALQQYTADYPSPTVSPNVVSCAKYSQTTVCTLSISTPGHWVILQCWTYDDDPGQRYCQWFTG